MAGSIPFSILVIWTFHIFINQVTSDGAFELEIKRIDNPRGQQANGTCCSGVRDQAGYCSSPCRTFFRVCLKEYQATIVPQGPCTFGELTTPNLGGNSFDVPTDTPGYSSPIRMRFAFGWPGTFSLIVEGYHDKTMFGPKQDSPRDLIVRLATQGWAEVGASWSSGTFHGINSNLTYQYRVVCDSGFYGPQCTDNCSPRDDKFGHYTCGTQGQKQCMDGWSGDFCDKPVCPENCHPEHGYCDAPNECKCNLGYQGLGCNECIPYPGCTEHGSCTKPWQCNCEPGWSGQFCSSSDEICAELQPCQNGGTCRNLATGGYSCTCLTPYAGTNCEIMRSSCDVRPCLNGGTCQDEGSGYECRCPVGFKGRHCESNALRCSDNPCEHRGTCESLYDGANYRCICPSAYTGDNCEEERNECDSNPCLHGSCIDELGGFRCVCHHGYSGTICDIDDDNCEASPCLHGGTCIDQPNSFTCRCLLGYTGTLCQTNVNDCALGRCANGGTCIDLLNDFLCSCARGRGGKDCTLNIDECAPGPCLHGGTCTDGVDSFTCTCMPGWYGDVCQYSTNGTSPNTFSSSSHNTPHPQITTPRSSTTTVNPEAGGAAQILVHDDSAIPAQITLIVALGVGLPCLVIIAVLIVLFVRRHRTHHASQRDETHHQSTACKDNRRNSALASSMNNRTNPCSGDSHDGGGGGGGVSGGGVAVSDPSLYYSDKVVAADSCAPCLNAHAHLKVTNETAATSITCERTPHGSGNTGNAGNTTSAVGSIAPSSRTLKNLNVRNDLRHVQASDTCKLYNKDLQDLKTKTRQGPYQSNYCSNTLDPRKLHLSPGPHISDCGYSGGGERGNARGEGESSSHVFTHKPLVHSDIYFMEQPAHTHYASEAILATEV